MNYIVNLVCFTIIIVGATNGGLLPESSHTQRPSSKGPLGSPSTDPHQGWSTESNGVESTGTSSAPNEYYDYQQQHDFTEDNTALQHQAKADIEAQAKAHAELALWKANQEAADALEKEAAAKLAAEDSEKELAIVQSYGDFLKAKNTALAGPFTGVNEGLNQPYFGPLAMVKVLPSGFIADTPEVTAARANHLAALAIVKTSEEESKAQAELALWKAKEDALMAKEKALLKAKNAAIWKAKHAKELSAKLASAKAEVEKAKSILESLSGASRNQNKPWFGPLAMPQILPDGFLADSAEVAAVKKSHLRTVASAEAAHAQAKAKEQADIALWKAKEAELKALAQHEAEIAAWKAKEAELKALAQYEAEIAAWKAKEAELKALAQYEADIAAWKTKEAKLKALAQHEAEIAAWKAKEAELKALAQHEADIAALKAKEAELKALAQHEAEIASWKAKEAELKALAQHEADIAAWKAKKEVAKIEAWKAKQEWN